MYDLLYEKSTTNLQLIHNKLKRLQLIYNKSTRNRSNGVWVRLVVDLL